MTTSDRTRPSHQMSVTTKERLRAAADRAKQRYPGPVGDLLHQELLSWMVFGRLLGSALIMRLTDELLAEVASTKAAESEPGDVQ